MVSFEKGVLKVKYEQERFAKRLFEFTFFINLLTIFLLYRVKNVGSLTGLAMFGAALLIWTTQKEKRVIIPYNVFWYGVFILYSASSWLWSTYVASSYLASVLKMIIILLMALGISVYVDTADDLERLMTIFIFAMLINIGLEFIYVTPSRWFSGGMGSNISKFNPNEISFWAVCAEMMCFYKFYMKKNQKLYILLVAFFMFFAFLSSSRKATAAAIIAPLMIMFISTFKKSYIFRLFLMAAVAIGLVYLIMNNENLYASVGVRFQSMLDYFSDDTVKSDGSLTARSALISIAKEMFYESPVLGKGMGNFARIVDIDYGRTFAYAHNNFWQILSENGVVGFILYYSMYVYCSAKLLKDIIVNKSRMSILYFCFFCLLLVLEWGIVSVNSKSAQIVIAMAYTATYVGEDDGRKYKYIENNVNKLEENENE